jgi:hypothetical protein
MNFLSILGVIGLVVLGLANVVGIGYGLYLWGSVGNPLGVAAWTAFVLWLKMIAVGLVLFITWLVASER